MCRPRQQSRPPAVADALIDDRLLHLTGKCVNDDPSRRGHQSLRNQLRRRCWCPLRSTTRLSGALSRTPRTSRAVNILDICEFGYRELGARGIRSLGAVVGVMPLLATRVAASFHMSNCVHVGVHRTGESKPWRNEIRLRGARAGCRAITQWRSDVPRRCRSKGRVGMSVRYVMK
jgi:hypothetical protein